MARRWAVPVAIAALISVYLFAQPDFGQPKDGVMRQVLGAFILALLADVGVAVVTALCVAQRRVHTAVVVLAIAVACDVIIFTGVSYWADLFAW